MRKLILKLLQKLQRRIKTAHLSPEGQLLLKKKAGKLQELEKKQPYPAGARKLQAQHNTAARSLMPRLVKSDMDLEV